MKYILRNILNIRYIKFIRIRQWLCNFFLNNCYDCDDVRLCKGNIYIYIWFGHASDYAYGYSTWKVAHRCRGLWSGSLSLYLKFSHQDFVDQMAGFELFTDETSVLHRYKMYKISSLWVYINDVFFFFSFLFKTSREKHSQKMTNLWKKYAKQRERKREKNVRPYFMRDGYSKMKHGYKYE